MAKITLDWNKYSEASIKAAQEGIVLIKNDNDALPFTNETKVALFGRMQKHYFKSGTGSGGMVNVNHTVDIAEALEACSGVKLNERLVAKYEAWEKENPIDPGLGWGKERWSQEEMVPDEKLVKELSQESDIAVIVIARTAGEDRDNTKEKGSYLLSDGEEQMLDIVCRNFKRTAVVLNVGNVIDMAFVEKYNPSAVLYVWQNGMHGGTTVANVLTGKCNPSGRLTDTIAKNVSDIPADKNFDIGDGLEDVYAEDIYVGYRYFETFAPEKVAYPFGFGLSYTSFSNENISFVSGRGGQISVSFDVKNTGNYSGKNTQLLFVSAPQGILGKPSRVLVGFSKTRELRPGEVDRLEINVQRSDYASFDDGNRLGLGTSWVVEAGTYRIYLGDDVRSAKLIGGFTVSETLVVEKLKSAMAPIKAFDRMIPLTNNKGGLTPGYEPVPLRRNDNLVDRLKFVPPYISQTADEGIKLKDVIEEAASEDKFIAQLTDDDLSLIIRGEGMGSPKVTMGTAAAFGGISKELKSYGIPTLCCSDGPSGMRIDSGKLCFSLPNGTCLASSFNTEAISDLFSYYGIEMLSNKVDVILGPGMNIHRHPLNGRNFEYFSEDPFLTGMITCAELDGLHRSHVTGAIKHFCVNNREHNRHMTDSVVSERALREIYLKGFELAVKRGGADCIMTSYNKCNGLYTSSYYDLNTVVLREQWGFTGIEMTDWWAHSNNLPNEEGVYTMHSSMARSQNDIYMVCSIVEKEALNEADTLECLTNGKDDMITRAELQRNAKNIVRFAKRMPAMSRLLGDGWEVNHIDCPFEDAKANENAAVYYKVGKETTISMEGADTSAGSDVVFGTTFDEVGFYEVTFVARSDASEIAQMPMTIFYTSIPLGVITWNGTGGNYVEKQTQVLCLSKHSVYRFHFTNSGVELKEIRFKFLRAFGKDERWDEILTE